MLLGAIILNVGEDIWIEIILSRDSGIPPVIFQVPLDWPHMELT